MPKLIDLMGQKFGRWTVVGEAPNRGRRSCWAVVCDCGTEREVLGQTLRSGRSKSCGCLQREKAREPRRVKHGHSKARNGKPSKEYQAWCNAKHRCYYRRDVSFKDYGAKGKRMCDEWRNNFVAFFRDMGHCPEGCSLDRIDPFGNYEPGNCRWLLDSEQNKNRTNCRYYTHDGETLTRTDWARRLGKSTGAIDYWFRKGYSIADIHARWATPLAA